MRKLVAVTAAAVFVAAIAGAQPPAPVSCTSSGYAPPQYGVFGQNVDGQTAYEIASPCIPIEVRDAAEAVGMGRHRPLGVKNVITIMFSAEGTSAGSGGTMDNVSKADFQISYVVPAMRLALEGAHADGKPLKEIRVFADRYAWNEARQGMGATPAMMTLADRAPLVKLTPFGALWSVIEAEGHAKVSKVNGKAVLTGASPYDGIEVTTTLDDKNLPESVTAKANGHVYGATFADYRDTWESKYLVIFPSQIRWTVDGRPLADLRVTAFKSNPYVVFPVPAGVRQAASN
jgi:hypothetical protein